MTDLDVDSIRQWSEIEHVNDTLDDGKYRAGVERGKVGVVKQRLLDAGASVLSEWPDLIVFHLGDDWEKISDL